MKSLRTFLGLAMVASVALGCSGSTVTPVKTSGEVVKGAPSPGKDTPASSKTEPTPTAEEGKKPSANPGELPADLKNEAYAYYGLGMTKPLVMEVTSSSQSGIQTGTQEAKLISVEDGKATYEIERTGNLGDLLGGMTVTLERDGIYVKSSTIAKVGMRDLELPNNLAPGSTWESSTTVDQPGKQLNVINSFKVVGVQPLKTKAGNYQALLITSNGSGTVNGQNVKMQTKSWYVKDRGAVKAVLSTTDGSGRTSSVTVEESK
jgi:hypothetical protein